MLAVFREVRAAPARRARVTALLCGFGLGVVGCGGPRIAVAPSDPEYEFRLGQAEMQRQHWISAQDHLKRFLDLHPGHARADSAQYLMGGAKFGAKLYPEAAVEYQIVGQEYPRSDLRLDAAFQECVSYARQMRSPNLDPTPAIRARTCFDEFLLRASTAADSARARVELGKIADFLAEKDFQIGKMYVGMKLPASARVYLEDILQKYPESSRIPDVWFLMGRAAELEKNWADAAAAYRRVLQESATSKAAPGARNRLEHLLAVRPELASATDASPPSP